MAKLKRGDKIYLDNDEKESAVNPYLDCRDGIVECFEYVDSSGYGAVTRLFLCENTKHESISIIRQTLDSITKEWIEEQISFDSDSFVFLKALINGNNKVLDGNYCLVRDY